MTARSACRCLLPLFLLLAGCADPGRLPPTLLADLVSTERVAVASLPEESSGDLTLLGNHLRDRIEATLVDRGVQVKARKDLVGIIDDAELADPAAEQRLWQQVGADILVRGSYILVDEKAGGNKVTIRLLLKAFRQESVTLVDSSELLLRLPAAQVASLSRPVGNIYQQGFKTVVGADDGSTPSLAARLDRPDGCYRPGDTATIAIDSEPGVYLFIFSLSCDGNVALLHPGPHTDAAPLTTAESLFPPPGSAIRALRLQPAIPGEPCRESFKLVVARRPLDFSYLPFPENRIYAGVNGRDIARVTATLAGVPDSRQQLLDYRIDPACPPSRPSRPARTVDKVAAW